MDFNKLNTELYQLSAPHRFPRKATEFDKGYLKISDWLGDLCYYYEKKRQSQEQYDDEYEDIERRRQEAEEELEKSKTALRRPKDIKQAVKRATEIVTEEIKVLQFLEQQKKATQKLNNMREIQLGANHADKSDPKSSLASLMVGRPPRHNFKLLA